jgi:NitT/TauT family transport system permease protein
MTSESKALSLVNAQPRIVPQATVKMAAVDESADIAVTAPATTAETASSHSSRPDEGDERSEWMAGLTMSAARWAVRLSALLAGLACWHYASSKGLTLYVRFEQIPGPLKVGEALINQLQHVAFYLHIGASLQRIAISYSLAAGIGITLGLLMGRSRFIRDLIFPYVEILRPIPGVAWIPLAILLWPTEEGSIIYITFLGALFPIILNTLHGVEQTPEVLIRAAQSLGASRMCIFRHVVLPGALPSICAGLAIGMGVSWFSLLAGEIISGQYGIGYFTWNAYSIINPPDIIVGMLSIGLLGAATTALVHLITRPALAWQRKAR